MHYFNKSILAGLMIVALLLFPMTRAASNDLPQQVSRLQDQMLEANARIAVLASEQQKTRSMLSSFQTSLNTAHQEINDLNNSGVFKLKLSTATNAGVRRTANGHGR